MSLFSKTAFDRVCKLFGFDGLSLIKKEGNPAPRGIFTDKSVKDSCCGDCSAQFVFVYLDTVGNDLYFQDGSNTYTLDDYNITWYYRDELNEWVEFATAIGFVDLDLYPVEVSTSLEFMAIVSCKSSPGVEHEIVAGRAETQYSNGGIFFTRDGGEPVWIDDQGYICTGQTLEFTMIHPDYQVFSGSWIAPFSPLKPFTDPLGSGSYLLEIEHLPTSTFGFALVEITYVNNTSAFTPNTPQVVCENDTIVLTANSLSQQNYQWRRNGVDMPGETLSSLNVSLAGSYSLRVTNTVEGYTCQSESPAVVVTAAAQPQVTIDVTTDDPVNYPNGVPSEYAGHYLWWDGGDVPAPGYEFCVQEVYPSYSWNTGLWTTQCISSIIVSGAYEVEVTSVDGCTNDSQVFLDDEQFLLEIDTLTDESGPGACDGFARIVDPLAVINNSETGMPGDLLDLPSGRLTVQWSTGLRTDELTHSNLCAGNYWVRVCDTLTLVCFTRSFTIN